MSTIRLNKLLATRGIGARRKCDLLIESGVVRVNGEVVTAPGARVVEGRDRITVSGRPLPELSAHRYLMLHKPVGVITTLHDPEGRRNIADLIPREGRLYPVGRLDADTSGLLIITNDGALAHHLMHPRYGLTKFYRVLLAREPNDQQLARLAAGVEFEPGVRSAPARVRRRDPVPRGAVIEVALHEGRHRQVRRMCEAVGLTVLGLHRWAYGPLKLGELARGVWRELSEAEVAALRSASARPRPRPAGAGDTKGETRPRGPRAERLTPREVRPRAESFTRPERSPRGEAFVRSQRRPRREGFVPPERGVRGPTAERFVRPDRGPRGGPFVRPERNSGSARGARGPRPERGQRPRRGREAPRPPARAPRGPRRSDRAHAESIRRGAGRTQRAPFRRSDDHTQREPFRGPQERRQFSSRRTRPPRGSSAGPRGRAPRPPGRARPASSSTRPRARARGPFRGARGRAR